MNLPRTAMFGSNGANLIVELGRQQDMVVFFTCLERLTRSILSEASRFILLDRLFKRYLREEDLDEAVLSMDVARRQFQLATTNSIDLVGLGLDKNDTFLSFDDINLAKVLKSISVDFLDAYDLINQEKECLGSTIIRLRSAVLIFQAILKTTLDLIKPMTTWSAHPSGSPKRRAATWLLSHSSLPGNIAQHANTRQRGDRGRPGHPPSRPPVHLTARDGRQPPPTPPPSPPAPAPRAR